MSSEPETTQPAADTIDNGINNEKSNLDDSKELNKQSDSEVNGQYSVDHDKDESSNDPVRVEPPPPVLPSTNASSGMCSSVNKIAATTLSESSSAKRRRIANDELDKSHGPSTSKKGGGLSSLVGSLAKKDKKQSMLAKSAQDWRQFVQEEKLEEELDTHLKSRDSFLDKQEFLLRADYKQFEHERDLRAQERKIKQPQGDTPH
uniref:Craniofacial development protein 1 n=1 Tax=Meloidogyne javanica TaxID=6303 RepID=A0A915MGQ8_MELJA